MNVRLFLESPKRFLIEPRLEADRAACSTGENIGIPTLTSVPKKAIVPEMPVLRLDGNFGNFGPELITALHQPVASPYSGHVKGRVYVFRVIANHRRLHVRAGGGG